MSSYLKSYLNKDEIDINDILDIVNNSDEYILKGTYKHKIYLEAMRDLAEYNYRRYLRGELKGIYVCNQSMRVIKTIIDTITTTNTDWFISVVGHNGSGKSTFSYGFIDGYCKLLGIDTAKAITENTIYDEEDFFEYLANIRKKKPLEPVFLDEGANILFNRESMSKNRKWIMKFINVMRFLNKMVIITSLKARMLDINIRNQRVKSVIYIDQDFDIESTTRMAYFYEGDNIKKFYRFEEGEGSLPDTDIILQFSENMVIADAVLEIKKRYAKSLENVSKIELLKTKLKKLEETIELRKRIEKIEGYNLEVNNEIKNQIDNMIYNMNSEINRIKIGDENDSNSV